MQFLNSWMLLGLLGIAIPVILHLLNRRQAKVIEWGAMRFLLDSLVSRRRRVLLEEILLLATRCLIVALAALALARPFVLDSSRVPWLVVLPAGLLAVVLFAMNFALWRYPVWRWRVILAALVLALAAAGAVLGERWLNLKRFGHGGSRDVALVLDGSSSMTMTVEGRSNFARAVKEAQQYIESVPRGYAFSIVIAGSVPNLPVPVPVTDRKHLLQALEDAVPVQGTMQVPDTLAVAAATLAQGSNPGKQIILIGDGQRIGWNPDQPETWEHLREAFARLPVPPQVIFRRLALPATIRNASLADITFSREVIGTDREVRIDVTVANTGTEAITPQEVRLTIGTRMLTDRSLGQLAPGASATVCFRYRFERAGTEVVRASVVANDELPGDDEAIRVVQIVDRLRVLVVDAAPAARLLDRAGAFVALGLMPSAATFDRDTKPKKSATDEPAIPAKSEFLVTPEMISVPELNGASSWSDADTVVLADVPRLPPETAAALTEFVAQGGGLLVIEGMHADPEFYNNWCGDGGRLMPISLEKLIVSEEKNRPVPDAKTFSHPALRTFAAGSDLEAAQFNCHWQVGEGDPSVRIGARLSNGMPLLAERRYGRGRVLQVNVPMDLSAGNLVARSAFVPLIHELVYHLIRPMAADLNIQPARGATIKLAENIGGKSKDVRHGLRGEYFARADQLAGGVVRIDPTIDFNWPGSPVEGIPAKGYHVQWTGSLAVPEPGTYHFNTGPGALMTLWINGRKIFSPPEGKGSISLQTGKRYDFRVDYQSGDPRPALHVSCAGVWAGGRVLPTEVLSPVRGGEENWSSDVATLIQGPEKQPLAGRYAVSDDGIALRIDSGLVPGLYHARVPEAIQHKVVRLLDKDGLIPFSVTVSGDESRLDPLLPDELKLINRHIVLLTALTAEDTLRSLRGESFGRELWQILMFAALVLLILEIVLTRWIAIQRRTGEEGHVDFEGNAKSSAQFRDQLSKMRGRRGGGEM